MANNNNPMVALADLSGVNGGVRVDLGEFLKNQIQGMVGHSDDVLEFLSLSPNVKKRVEVLRKIQDEHDLLEAQYQLERAYIEAKYELLYQPLYTKRYEIVNGLAEVEGVAMETAAETAQAGEKGVPSFWLIALKNNDVLAQEITERDEEALVFLNDIKYTKIAEPLGFKLEFFFDPNPYFSNTVLTKTYVMLDEDEPTMENVIGTTIDWLPGKCLTGKNMNNKQKEPMNTNSITKTESDSFFNFFNPPEIPESGLELSKEECDEILTEAEQDYDIGSTIRDEIIPHAVAWFTGEAIEEESDDDEDDDEDEDEDMSDGLPNEEEDDNNQAEKNLGDAPHGEKPADCNEP